jgi:peptidoglycan/LPS O-acetylase OafA/YrhL
MSLEIHGFDMARGAVTSSAPVPRAPKLQFIQLVRGLAIIGIVACHCQDLFDVSDPVRSAPMNMLSRHVNVVFVIVSGFLFQYLSSRYDYGKYLKSKATNVLTPYVVCSAPAILLYVAGLKATPDIADATGSQNSIDLVITLLLTGKAIAPYWFVPMACIFFLMAPVWRWIDQNPRWFLIIPVLLCVSAMVGRSFGDVSPLQNALFYAPAYLIGMATSHFRETVLPWLARLSLPLMMSVFVALLLRSSPGLFDFAAFFSKILFALGLVGWLSQTGLAQSRTSYNQDALAIGESSFGIYFIHYYIVSAINMLIMGGYIGRPHGFAAFAALLVAVMAASVMIVLTVQIACGRSSKMLVGA